MNTVQQPLRQNEQGSGENKLFIQYKYSLTSDNNISAIAFPIFSPFATLQNADIKIIALVLQSAHTGWLWPEMTTSSTNQTTIL